MTDQYPKTIETKPIWIVQTGPGSYRFGGERIVCSNRVVWGQPPGLSAPARLIAYLAGLNAPPVRLSFVRPPARRLSRALWWAREVWRALP